MSEVRDPAIKLFGRNIPLTDGQFLSDSLHNSDLDSHTPSISHLMYECEEATKTKVDGRLVEKYCKQNIPSDLDDRKDNCQNSIQENEVKADQKPEEDGVSKGDICGQEKVLKRPTKALPCPRCNSLETKFCYFNNYNVNQPRHFCKNCRRYWTAGGIMRNVPVRAGKRKNKHLSSQCNQVVVPPNVVPVIRGGTIISAGDCSLSRVGHPASLGLVKGIGEVLKFSTNAPLCESMATVLNLKDQKKSDKISSTAAEDDGEEPLSSGSSLVAATSQESELLGKEIEQFALPGHDSSYNPKHTLQCYPVPPWAYPWNPDWNAMVFGLNSGIPNSTHMGSPPMVAVPGFSGPSITFPFIPASKWNAPLVGSTGNASVSSSTSNSSCSGNSSPTLGKHSRDTNLQAEEIKEQCLWVPKTLRIDDLEEAAKSSIWSTLGIKPENEKPIIRGGIFKAFQSKSDTSSHTLDADQVLQANLVAFSRSQSFRESTH